MTELLLGLEAFLVASLGWQLKAAALIALVWLFVTAFPRLSPANRGSVWSCVLVALFLLPIAGPSLPAVRILPQWSPESRADPMALRNALGIPIDQLEFRHVPFSQSEAVDPRAAVVPAEPSSAVGSGALNPETVNPNGSAQRVGWLAIVWGGVSLVFAGRLLIAVFQFWCLRASGKRCESGRASGLFRSALRAQSIAFRVDLVVLPNASGPMTGGLLRPTVFLPKEAEEWSGERLESVFGHELSHVKRRDCFWLLAIQFLAIYYWINPLYWLVVHRWGTECELACDDHVLQSGISPKVYAATLLELCTRSERSSWPSVLGVDGGRLAIERRIQRTLQMPSAEKQMGRWGTVFAGLMILVSAGGLGALQTKQSSGAQGDFSNAVAVWVADAVESEYPDRNGTDWEILRGDFESFINDICETNSLAQGRRRILFESLPVFVPAYVDRGGEIADLSASTRTDQFDRPLEDVRLKDDLLSLKWSLWRALTKPELSEDEQQVLKDQQDQLRLYLKHRDALVRALKDPAPFFGNMSEDLFQHHLDWFCIRERLLFERSVRDPLEAVFDQPLSAEKFADLWTRLQDAVKLAQSAESKMPTYQLPNVRQLAGLVKQSRYSPPTRAADFELPFSGMATRLGGPRSWDDPVHLRIKFLEHHPELFQNAYWKKDFSMIPVDRKNQPVRSWAGIAHWDAGTVDVETIYSQLMRPVSERPIFIHAGLTGSRDLIQLLSWLGRLSYVEKRALRTHLKGERISSMDELGSTARQLGDSSALQSAIAKVQALWKWQWAVIDEYQQALEAGWLSADDEALLEHLLADLKRRTLDEIFRPREEFRGIDRGNQDPQALFLSARYDSDSFLKRGPYNPNQVRTPSLFVGGVRLSNDHSFPIQIQGEETPLLFGRFETGDKESLVVRIGQTEADLDPGLSIRLPRDQAVPVTLGERHVELTYVSTWWLGNGVEAKPAKIAYVQMAYFPRQRE